MIGNWGRRYLAALQTPKGRDKVATGYLIAAVVMNLVAMIIPPGPPNNARIATFLLGIGTGILIVSIVNFILNRRAE